MGRKKIIKEINGKDNEINPSLYDLLGSAISVYDKMNKADFSSLVRDADQTKLKSLCREFKISTMGSLSFIRESLISEYDKRYAKRKFEEKTLKVK